MQTIDDAIHTMYSSISFEPGARPDWDRHREVMAPAARMVRITDDGIFEFDSPAFIANIESMIASGALPGFWEAEIWRETRLVGDELAHVLSAYEMRRSRNGEPLGRGVNSIQLFRGPGGWRISAMLWRREGANVRIPDRPDEL